MISEPSPGPEDLSREELLEAIVELHAQIDAEVARRSRAYASRLHCAAGCCDCCVDDLTVFEVEALRIEAHCADLLYQGEPHPPGACVFLSEDGKCRIYEHRPYVCRTQGLPLRWMGIAAEPEAATGGAFGIPVDVAVEEPAPAGDESEADDALGDDLDADLGGPLTEYRDICPLNEHAVDLADLPEEACWEIGPVERELRALQMEMTGTLQRVPLRDLFASS